MHRTAGGFASRSACRSPPYSAVGARMPPPRCLLANAQLDDPFEPRELHELAAGLGADVPFFLYDDPQRHRRRLDTRADRPSAGFRGRAPAAQRCRQGVDLVGLRGVRQARWGQPATTSVPRASATQLAGIQRSGRSRGAAAERSRRLPAGDRAPQGRRVPRGCQRCGAHRVRPVRRSCRRERRGPPAPAVTAPPGARFPSGRRLLEPADVGVGVAAGQKVSVPEVRDHLLRRLLEAHVVVGARPAGPSDPPRCSPAGALRPASSQWAATSCAR